jgi:hypothetical protein
MSLISFVEITLQDLAPASLDITILTGIKWNAVLTWVSDHVANIYKVGPTARNYLRIIQVSQPQLS